MKLKWNILDVDKPGERYVARSDRGEYRIVESTANGGMFTWHFPGLRYQGSVSGGDRATALKRAKRACQDFEDTGSVGTIVVRWPDGRPVTRADVAKRFV